MAVFQEKNGCASFEVINKVAVNNSIENNENIYVCFFIKRGYILDCFSVSVIAPQDRAAHLKKTRKQVITLQWKELTFGRNPPPPLFFYVHNYIDILQQSAMIGNWGVSL